MDLGAVGIKAALLATEEDELLLGSQALAGDLWEDAPRKVRTAKGTDGLLALTRYRRIRGRPLDAARQLLADVLESLGRTSLDGLRITGSGAGLLSGGRGFPEESEYRALAAAVRLLHPEARTLFEIGGETSRILVFEQDPGTGDLGIVDYQTNGDCAAGTGGFLDQQAGRLRFSIEEVGEVALASERSAKIAGRCSVFAKTDMIHAQQKGYRPEEVLRGLCETVARNFRSAVAKTIEPKPPVLFVGGVAANAMVVKALKEVFGLEELAVPQHHASFPAIGCAVLEAAATDHVPVDAGGLAEWSLDIRDLPRARPLSMDKVVCLRDRVHPVQLDDGGPLLETTLGIDVGSVSTNLVLLDRQGRIVREVYTRTRARPVEVVTEALLEMGRETGSRVRICGVGTTGSGRELIGEVVGADTVNDEITAHKTGALFIANSLLDGRVDTIFEIGGQDAKYIGLEDGVVVDFAMNEACAAGTGSFLEERAEELGVSIKDEFASRALSSTSPVRLGERCTVFMERDVTALQQRGAATDDLLAGLALSVATNYINRVVRGRRITGTIFFQGGTAYNDAVAAAFAQILDREIVVPPYNGVVGAVGAALLAWEKHEAGGKQTRFRGWDLRKVDCRMREFVCQACENRCDIQEFQVEGEKTYWGDQCGDRFRRRAKSDLTPITQDLLRMRAQWLVDGYDPSSTGRAVVAIPRALYTYERFPYWNAFFRALGFGVRLTAETTRRVAQEGVEASVAEPCFPVQVAHGHIRSALGMPDADFVFIPNMVNAEAANPRVQSFFCPWGMTLPFVARSAASFEAESDRIIHPLIRYRGGRNALAESLYNSLKRFGARRRDVEGALVEAEEAQEAFTDRIRQAGLGAVRILRGTGEAAVLMVGRPYNLYDPVVNIDLPRKIRDLYGVNVLPLEFLASDGNEVDAINSNMFWSYGRRILQTAMEASRHTNLHLVYVTNFKCGPDSYIKHFVRDAFGRPFLTLSFDGHANDAGMLTRVEAFLDSQGILRPWAHRVAPASTTAFDPDGVLLQHGAGCAMDCASCSPAPASRDHS